MKSIIILACAVMTVALATPLAKADLIAVNDDGSAKVRFLLESELTVENLSRTVTGLRAVAVGDVVTTSTGDEIIIAYGSPSMFEVRAADGTTVLLSRNFGEDVTGSGPETVHDIAVGECRADLGGLEIGVATQASTQVGFVRVLNANTGGLGDQNGTGAGMNVTAVAIADANSRFNGGELIFCWQYEPNGDTFNTQIAVFTPHPTLGFIGHTIRNVVGAISAQNLAVAEAVGDGGTPEILAGSDFGEIELLQPSIEDPGNAALLSYAASNPDSFRAGFENIEGLAIGDVQQGVVGGELIVASADLGGTLRVIDSNSESLGTDLAGNSDLIAEGFGIQAYNGLTDTPASEIFVASPDEGGLILILDGTLAELDRRSGLGTWFDLSSFPPEIPNSVQPVEWSLY